MSKKNRTQSTPAPETAPAPSGWPVDTALREQLEVMLQLRDALNSQVFANTHEPDWRALQLGWHRAVYVGAVEMLEQLRGLTWWTPHQEPNWVQARTKLIDLWHASLAWSLENSKSVSAAAENLAARLEYGREHPTPDAPTRMESLHSEVDRLVAGAGKGLFNAGGFANLLRHFDMTFDELFRSYVGASMLERLRLAHGWPTGAYRKQWAGEEDSVHLARVLEELADVTPHDLPGRVLEALEARYQATLKQPESAKVGA